MANNESTFEFLKLEKVGVWQGNLTNPTLLVYGYGKKGYYRFECMCNSNGWYITVIRNGTIRGSFQGSTFNLELEINAAAHRF